MKNISKKIKKGISLMLVVTIISLSNGITSSAGTSYTSGTVSGKSYYAALTLSTTKAKVIMDGSATCYVSVKMSGWDSSKEIVYSYQYPTGSTNLDKTYSLPSGWTKYIYLSGTFYTGGTWCTSLYTPV